MIDAATSDIHTSSMSLKDESMLPPDVWKAMSREAVGQRLSLLRRALNMTPSEMADTLGIERTYWSRYENGRQGLSDTVAAMLVVRYDVTLDFLILGRWDKLPFELAEKIRSLPPE